MFLLPRPTTTCWWLKAVSLELSSSGAEKVHYARPSAEPLFASVADIYQKNAIAVVLTGGDGDGSFGVQIIKEQGGKIIAQDRPTSQDFSMPETSIKTGDVDFILPLERDRSQADRTGWRRRIPEQGRREDSSLSSIGWRRGPGRGGSSFGLPLSSVLSPLVPPGERKKKSNAPSGKTCDAGLFSRRSKMP